MNNLLISLNRLMVKVIFFNEFAAPSVVKNLLIMEWPRSYSEPSFTNTMLARL
jgi:hypothetical protein